jgi:hypothetical protein
MEALENLDIVAIGSFVALVAAWVILPLRAPAVVTPAMTVETAPVTAVAA